MAVSCAPFCEQEVTLLEELSSTQLSSKHLEGGLSLVSYFNLSNLVNLAEPQFLHL